MSGILLRKADSLVEVTRLIDEENRTETRSSKALSPWVAATKSKDEGSMPKAQLTQDWVDKMNQIVEETPWREFTMHLPLYRVFMNKFV